MAAGIFFLVSYALPRAASRSLPAPSLPRSFCHFMCGATFARQFYGSLLHGGCSTSQPPPSCLPSAMPFPSLWLALLALWSSCGKSAGPCLPSLIHTAFARSHSIHSRSNSHAAQGGCHHFSPHSFPSRAVTAGCKVGTPGQSSIAHNSNVHIIQTFEIEAHVVRAKPCCFHPLYSPT